MACLAHTEMKNVSGFTPSAAQPYASAGVTFAVGLVGVGCVCAHHDVDRCILLGALRVPDDSHQALELSLSGGEALGCQYANAE